jgi:hypothetical protein
MLTKLLATLQKLGIKSEEFKAQRIFTQDKKETLNNVSTTGYVQLRTSETGRKVLGGIKLRFVKYALRKSGKENEKKEQ